MAYFFAYDRKNQLSVDNSQVANLLSITHNNFALSFSKELGFLQDKTSVQMFITTKGTLDVPKCIENFKCLHLKEHSKSGRNLCVELSRF